MSFVACAIAVALLADTRPQPDGGMPAWAPTLRRADEKDAAHYVLRQVGERYAWSNDAFEASVARDGVVTFKDKHGTASASAFSFGLAGKRKHRPEPLRRGSAEPNRQAPVLRPTWMLPSQSPNDRSIPWDKVCPPHVPCNPTPSAGMVEASGSFDLTDEFLGTVGRRPHALEKARFLSATFELRIKLATQAHKEDLVRALDQLPRRLEELWADGRYSARERRRILYELWSETETSSEGERAAAIIMQFIRRRLPCGSADGYGKDELEAFATRRSGQRFLPDSGCDR